MSEDQRVSTSSEVYNEWVKANPGMDPMQPTDEQDADYMKRLVEADPSIIGKGWAEALSLMSEDEIAELLQSPEYNGVDAATPDPEKAISDRITWGVQTAESMVRRQAGATFELVSPLGPVTVRDRAGELVATFTEDGWTESDGSVHLWSNIREGGPHAIGQSIMGKYLRGGR